MTNAKELNERWIQAFNERDWETERGRRTDDYLAHMSGAPGPLDNEGWSGFMAMFTSALPYCGSLSTAPSRRATSSPAAGPSPAPTTAPSRAFPPP